MSFNFIVARLAIGAMSFNFIVARLAIGALLGFIISLFFKSQRNKRIVLYTFMAIGFVFLLLYFAWFVLLVTSMPKMDY